MPTIREFFNEHGRSKKYVAARLGNKDKCLYYCELDDVGVVRPSVYLSNYLEKTKTQVRGKISVNYPTNAWINMNSPQELTYTDPAVANLTYTKVQAVPKELTLWEQFGLDKLGPNPSLLDLGAEQAQPGESRARRIYMLACFCLLKKAGLVTRDRTLGHNIGSILTSKDGKILSWGVNTGGYRHAEVNTIINYFRLNPKETYLPADSVIFSTLKPCSMCSTLITEAWRGGKARIWYGMMDEGASGSTPLLGSKATEFKGEDFELDVWELLSEDGTLDSAISVKGTKPVQVAQKGGKVDLYATLNASGGSSRRMSAADWVDKSPEVIGLIEAAVTKFKGKVTKAKRDDGPVKRVLAHLAPFI